MFSEESVPGTWCSASIMKSVDYALYLVTGRELLPPGKVRLSPQSNLLLSDCRTTMSTSSRFAVSSIQYHDFQVIQALIGGVSVVQVREKDLDTADVRLVHEDRGL